MANVIGRVATARGVAIEDVGCFRSSEGFSQATLDDQNVPA